MTSPRPEPLEFRDDQPVTELVIRAWRLLFRHGNRRFDQDHNELRGHTIEPYKIRSRNRFLIIEKLKEVPTGSGWSRIETEMIFSVDEEGEIGACETVEIAEALEFFRQRMLLDDLADV